MNKISCIETSIILSISLNACSVIPSDAEPLAGLIEKEVLLERHTLFKSSYRSFKINEEDKNTISQWPSSLHIDIYFGAWCHDSQREVPKILAILKENSNLTYRLIALDPKKSDPDKLAFANNVKFTPTMVVYIGDKKIGRIVERPIDSLVSDITLFVAKSNKVID